MDFLRHIERTRVLVHVIDMAAEHGRDPFEDFVTIMEELSACQSTSPSSSHGDCSQ